MTWYWPDIEDIFEQVLTRHGIPNDDAHTVSRAIAADLAREVGGDQHYIPKRTVDQDEVRRLFNGQNHRELAKLYGVTPRTIRRWVDDP